MVGDEDDVGDNDEVGVKKRGSRYAFSEKEIFDWLQSEDPSNKNKKRKYPEQCDTDKGKATFRKGAKNYKLSDCRTKMLYVQKNKEAREVPIGREAIDRILKGNPYLSMSAI